MVNLAFNGKVFLGNIGEVLDESFKRYLGIWLYCKF